MNEDGWYNFRNFHLNYYAVKAIKAQAYLWCGDMVNALREATEVINAIGNGVDISLGGVNALTLRLMDVTEINDNTYSLTREALFAVSVENLALNLSNHIEPYYSESSSWDYFFLKEASTEDLYNNSNTDYRFTKLLAHNTVAATPGYTPLKYFQSTNTDGFFRNKVNVVRLPELYLIAAECNALQGNAEEAMRWLNQLRQTRGLYEPLVGLSPEDALQEIGREYQREFLGEGIAYFYFKRTGASSTPIKEEMTDADYLLPYPVFETQSGRIQ